MLGVIIIFIFAVYLAFFFPYDKIEKPVEEKSPRYNAQMKQLWSIAQSSMKDKKPIRAEKALLTILKFDEKNAAAYNRLGILYAKEQKYDEAIECFEIAQSLDNNASSLHNVGLIYLETGAYEKAEMAFEQALEMEGDLPARFIALAKAREKLGKRKGAVEALENAYELDRSTSTLRQILSLYESAEDQAAIAATTARIEEQIAASAANRKRTSTSRRLISSRTPKTQKPTTKISTTSHRVVSRAPKKTATKITKSTTSPQNKKSLPKNRKRI